jgi:hypothetical protein
MPVPIDNDWIKGLLELGECLNTSALHHDIDILDIRVEPEFGYIHVRGTKVDPSGTKMREMFHATQWRDLGVTDIKISPQGTAIPTGASN